MRWTTHGGASKSKLQCDLRNTRLSGSRHLPKGDVTVIANRRIWECCLHSIPLRVIECVKCIRTELKMPVLVQRKSLRQRQIHVVLARPTHGTQAGVAAHPFGGSENRLVLNWWSKLLSPCPILGLPLTNSSSIPAKSEAVVSTFCMERASPDSIVPIPEMRQPVSGTCAHCGQFLPYTGLQMPLYTKR